MCGPPVLEWPITSADGRSRLLTLIQEWALLRGKPIPLASGGTTDLYFDLRRCTLHPEAANLIADALLPVLASAGAHQVGGMAVGAVPMVSVLVARSWPALAINGFFVRKASKEHGTRQRIDGNFDPHQATVLVEDVTTTGGSVLQAVEAVRNAGGSVSLVLTIVDRLEGARENLARAGVELKALFSRDDFRD